MWLAAVVGPVLCGWTVLVCLLSASNVYEDVYCFVCLISFVVMWGGLSLVCVNGDAVIVRFMVEFCFLFWLNILTACMSESLLNVRGTHVRVILMLSVGVEWSVVCKGHVFSWCAWLWPRNFPKRRTRCLLYCTHQQSLFDC